MNTISTPKRTFQLLSFTVTKWQPAIHCSFLLIIDFLIGTTSCSFHEAAAEQYVWMNPCDGFYSQPSVGHSVHELHTKMCESGYDKRFPINGVRYPDGRTVFFDNRRPLAACMAGVPVYVRVHDCDALAPKAVRNNPMLSRPICLCDGTTIAPPDQMTWGDAIRMRSIGGARFNGGHLPEAPLYPPGRQQAPSIRLPCEIDGMLAAPAPRLQAPPTTTPPRPANCINGPSLSGPTKLKSLGGPLGVVLGMEAEYQIEESGINPTEYMPSFLVSGLKCLSDAEEYAKQIVSTDPCGAAVVDTYERLNKAATEVCGGYKWARRNVGSYCDESLRNILSSGGGGSIREYRPVIRLYGTRCY